MSTNKIKTQYSCQECGCLTPKWTGQCQKCNAWNSMTEIAMTKSSPNQDNDYKFTNYSGQSSNLIELSQVVSSEQNTISTGFAELDRAFGKGIVHGSVSLIGGDPGIGKSTLLLQLVNNLSKEHKVIYVSGEESAEQLKARADRLCLDELDFFILTETNTDEIINISQQYKPKILIIDSIQTMWLTNITSAPGTVSQVREVASILVKYAKQTNTIVILVGHVTKDGGIAGPRVLEHMVDSVLYFEGEQDSKYRMLRAVKNRFGAVNELGIFAMTEQGLREIHNPSAIFLARNKEPKVGSVTMVSWEGSRPFLIEIQALVDESHLSMPRRVCVGLEPNRLSLLLAVLNRHAKIKTGSLDIFINIVGGVKISETALDLAVIAAIVSSLQNKALSNDLIVFGEIGLSGEVRPVQHGLERLKEAAKLGFKQALIPNKNMSNKITGIDVTGTNNLLEALQAIELVR